MKTTPLHNAWSRLIEAARKAPAEEPLLAPHGFSSRIGALSAGALGHRIDSLAQITWGPLFVTSMIMVAVISFNLAHHTRAADTIILEDPVGDLLNMD